MNNTKIKKFLENDNTSHLRLKTNKSVTLKNFHSSQTSKKLLLNRTRDNSYNIIKRSGNFINKPKLHLISNQKIGISRHFDRKKLKENKSIIIPKHHLKLFKDNKFENSVLNKSINKYKLNNSSIDIDIISLLDISDFNSLILSILFLRKVISSGVSFIEFLFLRLAYKLIYESKSNINFEYKLIWNRDFACLLMILVDLFLLVFLRKEYENNFVLFFG